MLTNNTDFALILLEWVELRREGKLVTAEELCANAPELLDAVKRHIAAVEAVEQVGLTLSIADAQGTRVTQVAAIDVDSSQASAAEVRPDPALRQAPPGYEFLAVLGRGGMGVVFKARDLKLNRIVAVKMVLGGELASPKALVRFLAEAEALAALQHPNVVHVHERGQHEGLPYFVMEYCPGGSLGAKVRENPLAPRVAAELVEQLARGVAAAHASNILHRDLKPENVLFTADGTPKIADFGLAKRFDDSSPQREQGLTQTGAILGTPSYMAPEQAMGETKRIGPAADVYSLGALLYRTLTGRPPFLGANGTDTIRQVIDDEPLSPSDLVPSLPRDLATICLKCLQKEPARRYTASSELADDLRRFLEGRPIEARPVGRFERAVKWGKRNPVVTGATLAVMLALAIGATVSYVNYLDAKEARNSEAARVKERDGALARADDAVLSLSIQVTERDKAARNAIERADELRYQLGIRDVLLAKHALDNGYPNLTSELLDEIPVDLRGWDWKYLKRQAQRELMTLVGHAGPVTCVAVSADGSRIVTGSDDRTAKVWDARTGRELYSLRGHQGGLTCVSFSRDGTRIVTASWDYTARIWDAATGKPLLYHAGNTVKAAFDPDGSRIVTGSYDGWARIWDFRRGQLVAEAKYPDFIERVSFSPSGDSVLVGTNGKMAIWNPIGRLVFSEHKVRCLGNGSFSPDGNSVLIAAKSIYQASVLNVLTGQSLDLQGRHRSEITDAAFSPDGVRIVSCSGDRTAKVWEATSGKHLIDLHAGSLKCACFSADGSKVITGGWDGSVSVWDAHIQTPVIEAKCNFGIWSASLSPNGNHIIAVGTSPVAPIWDLRTGAELRSIDMDSSPVLSVAYSADGTRIVTGNWDRTAKVWDTLNGRLLLKIEGFTSSVCCVCFSPNGEKILATCVDGVRRIFSASSGEKIAELDGNGAFAACYSRDGSRIIAGGSGGKIQVFDASSYVQLHERDVHTSRVSAICTNPKGDRIVTACEDGTGAIVDSRDLKTLAVLRGHSGRLNSIVCSPDGARVISSSDDGSARIWDIKSGTLLLELRTESLQIKFATFSLDGDRVVTGGIDGKITVWDSRRTTAVSNLVGHRRRVSCVAFSSDGKHIITGSADETAKIWEVQSGKHLLDLTGHSGGVLSAEFSSDGILVVTGSTDHIVRVWNSKQGVVVGEFKGLSAEAISVAFSSDGKRVVACGSDGSVITWDVATQRPLVSLRERLFGLSQASFSSDGTRILTSESGNDRLWNASDGVEVKNERLPERPPSQSISPDGQIFARVVGNKVEIVSVAPDPDEFASRLLHTRPNALRYQEGLELARRTNNRLATQFYLDRLLSMPMQRTDAQYQERIELHNDPRLFARESFYKFLPPLVAGGRPVLHTLAVNGDRLAKRLVAQECLREGKPKPAIPLLFECMLSRPITSPPVEELLLAQAYLDLKQLDQAKRFYRAATEWLDQPCKPIRVLNIVSHSALNPWAGLGEAFAPVDDPRRNPFDWETWHECDVFRAEVERRLAK